MAGELCLLILNLVIAVDGHRYERAATAKKERIWPDGIVPYAIPANFSGEHGNLFKKAMRHWEEHVCVSFIPRQASHSHYIFFTIDKCGCCSYVGRRADGPQAISIGKNCDKFGIVIHELGHVLGFWHEHTRPDRDQFVDIFYKNIQPGQDYNFEKAKPGEVHSLGESYDFNSIMHYSKETFARAQQVNVNTILPKPSSGFTGEIGQREQLSDGDIRQANKLYRCALCGGTLFTERGKLISTGSHCVWRITAPEGHKIKLNITGIQGNCEDPNSDEVIVHDGPSASSPILDRVCGEVPFGMLSSATNRLYVEAKLWTMPPLNLGTFEVTCGGVLHSSHGLIQSPRYPDPYPPNADCSWTILVPEGRQVALKFPFFDLEPHKGCIYDRVVVYEGFDEQGIQVDSICGQPTTKQIVSRNNALTIRFISDSSVQKSGFEIEFVEEVDECSTANHSCQHICINTVGSYTCQCEIGFSLRPDGKTCESTCGGFTRASSGQISTPNHPLPYPPSKTCVWEIESPEGTQVFLNFTHFNVEGMKTECTYDYVRVGDRDKLCGEYAEPILLTSSNNRVRIEFSSDVSVERSGFSLSFIADTDECAEGNGGCEHGCENRLGGYECTCQNGAVLAEDGHHCKEGGCFYQMNDPHGIIHSPEYPNQYPKNLNCTWHIVSIPGHRISLHFDQFSVEEHASCRYDSVNVLDGSLITSPSLGIFCGSTDPPPLISTSNQLLLLFSTDSSVSRRGFHATYDSVCGGELPALSSPGYIYSHATYSDSRYSNGRVCKWTITSRSLRVRLRFDSFFVEEDNSCLYDYVEIYDGEEVEQKVVGRFCGKDLPPEIVSSGRTLILVMHTDDSVADKGFVAEYQETSQPASILAAPPHLIIPHNREPILNQA